MTETEWEDDEAFVRVQVADPDGYGVELFARAGGGPPARSRWTSFMADRDEERPARPRRAGQPRPPSARRARPAAQTRRRQREAAEEAFARLYPGGP